MMCDLCGDIAEVSCPDCLRDVCAACYTWCCLMDNDEDRRNPMTPNRVERQEER